MYPVIPNWRRVYPKPSGVAAPPLQNADCHGSNDASDRPPHLFSYAGGLHNTVSLYYASLCEYLIQYGVAFQQEGFGGSYQGVTYEDWIVDGTMYTQREDVLTPHFYPTGTHFVDEFLSDRPRGTAYGCTDGGCLVMERAQFVNYAASAAISVFGTNAPLSISLDFYSAFRSSCSSVLGTIANAISQVISQVQPIFLAPQAQWACIIKATPICAKVGELGALGGQTFCGYNPLTDVVALSGLVVPTSAGPQSAVTFLTSTLPAACQAVCLK